MNEFTREPAKVITLSAAENEILRNTIVKGNDQALKEYHDRLRASSVQSLVRRRDRELECIQEANKAFQSNRINAGKIFRSVMRWFR